MRTFMEILTVFGEYKREENHLVIRMWAILFPILAVVYFCFGGRYTFCGYCMLSAFLGSLTNRIVVRANNNKMPVLFKSPEKGREHFAHEENSKHSLMDSNTKFWWLGDIMEIGCFNPMVHASIGDVLIFGGLGLYLLRMLGLI